jgi:hypothetical protein
MCMAAAVLAVLWRLVQHTTCRVLMHNASRLVFTTVATTDTSNGTWSSMLVVLCLVAVFCVVHF